MEALEARETPDGERLPPTPPASQAAVVPGAEAAVAPTSLRCLDSGIVMDEQGELVLSQGDPKGCGQVTVTSVGADAEPAIIAAPRSDGMLEFLASKGVDLEEGSSVDGEDEDEEQPLTGSANRFAMPHIYSLKLIDFAHAEFTPGQGPDENALHGVRSLIRIFEELAG